MLIKMGNSKYNINNNTMKTQHKDHFKILYWKYFLFKILYLKILCVCVCYETLWQFSSTHKVHETFVKGCWSLTTISLLTLHLMAAQEEMESHYIV